MFIVYFYLLSFKCKLYLGRDLGGLQETKHWSIPVPRREPGTWECSRNICWKMDEWVLWAATGCPQATVPLWTYLCFFKLFFPAHSSKLAGWCHSQILPLSVPLSKSIWCPHSTLVPPHYSSSVTCLHPVVPPCPLGVACYLTVSGLLATHLSPSDPFLTLLLNLFKMQNSEKWNRNHNL